MSPLFSSFYTLHHFHRFFQLFQASNRPVRMLHCSHNTAFPSSAVSLPFILTINYSILFSVLHYEICYRLLCSQMLHNKNRHKHSAYSDFTFRDVLTVPFHPYLFLSGINISGYNLNGFVNTKLTAIDRQLIVS